MNEAKIRLSEKEAEMVADADLILTKNEILKKAKHLLETVQVQQIEIARKYPVLVNVFGNIPPKISRGENYRGLPYLILDYPRVFHAENTFAIRSFFWWGHFFSCTLQLSGTSKENYQASIINNFSQLDGYFLGVNDDPWEHHFETDNYVAIGKMKPDEFSGLATGQPFLKLARMHALSDWEHAIGALTNDFDNYLRIISNQKS